LYFEDRSHRCSTATPCTAAQVMHWDDRGHTASVLAVAAYAAGGAALVGGTALYLLGRRRDAEPPIAIAPAPGGALVTAGFAFGAGPRRGACASLCGSPGPPRGCAGLASVDVRVLAPRRRSIMQASAQSSPCGAVRVTPPRSAWIPVVALLSCAP